MVGCVQNRQPAQYILYCDQSHSQSNQSAGPVRFLIFCSISIFLLASLVAGSRPQFSAGAMQQGMYSTTPIHWNIKSAPASPGRSRVGPAFYVFSFLGHITQYTRTYCLGWPALYTTDHLHLSLQPAQADSRQGLRSIYKESWVSITSV